MIETQTDQNTMPEGQDNKTNALLDMLDQASHVYRTARAIETANGNHLTYAQWRERSDNLAGALSLIGLSEGETVILIGLDACGYHVALTGALRAGLHVALAPVHLHAPALALLAQRLKAAAILVADNQEMEFASLSVAFEAAALAHAVRLIGSVSVQQYDGALDLSPAACAALNTAPPDSQRVPFIISYDAIGNDRAPYWHSQRSLIEATSLLDRTVQYIDKETKSRAIVSTLAPTSLVGLAGGAILALSNGGIYYGLFPFSSGDFARLTDQLRSQNDIIVIPEAVLTLFSEAGWLNQTQQTSNWLAFTRRSPSQKNHNFTLVAPRTRKLFDLLDFGKGKVTIRPRPMERSALSL